MVPTPSFLPVFGVWALAVLSLWAPAPAIRGDTAWLWRPAIALACAAGWLGGYLDGRALLVVALYGVLAWSARTAQRAWLRLPLLTLTGLAAFMFALHRFPGFANPVLADHLRFSSDAPPFALRANFDTAVAGIVLMGTFCERIRTAAAWRAMLARVWPVLLSTLVVVLGFGLAAGYVRPDLKWTPYSTLFLALNLLFTCVTEEAFFRGFLLERIRLGLARWRGAAVLPTLLPSVLPAVLATVLSALLFGLAHARGGPALVVLATLAGLHYGAAYVRSRHIEGAILTHFALNAVHFVAFTYPNLL
jgi:membrane protease YdiL (CAAX protease family)